MANQVEVIPLGKLSRVLTRMGELEYLLNYVVIKLPVLSIFPVLLGRPWLYKAGVLEDWRKKEFCIGSIRIPWEVQDYIGETTGTSPGYTSAEDESEEEFSDCWMIVDAVKTLTEKQCGFDDPDEDFVIVEEKGETENDETTKEPEQEGKQESTKEAGPGSSKNDHALGKLDVPFNTEWVQRSIREDPVMTEYSEVFGRSAEESPSRIVRNTQYDKLTLTPDME
jgi:hypothetical protein